MEKCIYERLNLQKCPIDKKFSELKALEKCELFVEWVKNKWLKFTVILIFLSLFVLFFIGIWTENNEKGFDILKNLNTWVGFILGIVATIFSIISMFLSFYNIEKSKESEDKQQEISNKMLIDLQNALKETNSIISRQEIALIEKIDNGFKNIELKIKNVEEKIKYGLKNTVIDEVDDFN